MGKNATKKIIAIITSVAVVIAMSFTVATFDGSGSSNAATKQKLEMTFFDVGAGDCTYIEMPNGADILIDGGTSSKGATIVTQLLKKEKGMTLEAVISTHPDADHCGGLQTVFREMKVKKFYYPQDAPYDTQTAKSVIRLAKSEAGCKVVKAATPGKKISGGYGAYLKFIQGTTNYSSDNDDSLMVYVHYKKFDAGVFGDVADEASTSAEHHNLDVLLCPHHGSKYASSTEFIQDYDPEYLVISTDGHKYGHPNKETLQRYADYDKNIKLYRTDKKGNITVRTGGSTWKFNHKAAAITPSSGSTTDNDSGTTTKGKTVYITATGSRYHYNKNCRGLSNASKIYKTTLKAAKAKGLTLCKYED